MNDEALIAAARRGDKVAFSQLAERHLAMARRVALQMIVDEETARELVQDAMLQAYLSLENLRQPSQFAAWLRGILRNLCQNFLRRQRGASLSIEQMIEQWDDADLRLADLALDPQQLWEQHELQEQIQNALVALSPKNRITVQLFYFEQQSLAEIADALDVSINVVKSRLFQARQQLKLQLSPIYTLPNAVHSPPISSAKQAKIKSQRIKQRSRKMAKITKIHVITNAMTENCILYLLDTNNARFLRIWVGPHEGFQIAAYLQGESTERPMTFQFMATTLETIGARLEEVWVEAIKEITFLAVAKVRNGDTVSEIDARPSDAIGLALYLGSPIFVADELMRQSGQDLPQPFDEAQWVSAEQQRLGDTQSLTQEWQQKLADDPAFVAADAKAVLLQAVAMAKAMNHNYVGTEHILLSLLADADQPVAQLLQRAGVDHARLSAEFARMIGRGATPLAVEPVIVRRVIHALFIAQSEAVKLGQQPPNSLHLLLGLLGEGRGMAIRMLRTLGVDPAQLREEVLALYSGAP